MHKRAVHYAATCRSDKVQLSRFYLEHRSLKDHNLGKLVWHVCVELFDSFACNGRALYDVSDLEKVSIVKSCFISTIMIFINNVKCSPLTAVTMQILAYIYIYICIEHCKLYLLFNLLSRIPMVRVINYTLHKKLLFL